MCHGSSCDSNGACSFSCGSSNNSRVCADFVVSAVNVREVIEYTLDWSQSKVFLAFICSNDF